VKCVEIGTARGELDALDPEVQAADAEIRSFEIDLAILRSKLHSTRSDFDRAGMKLVTAGHALARNSSAFHSKHMNRGLKYVDVGTARIELDALDHDVHATDVAIGSI
jgi:hypothetical protein